MQKLAIRRIDQLVAMEYPSANLTKSASISDSTAILGYFFLRFICRRPVVRVLVVAEVEAGLRVETVLAVDENLVGAFSKSRTGCNISFPITSV